MLIRPSRLNITDEFPFAADRLERTETADRLTHLLERVKPPFVLSIDAKYGNGKTTFIQMWSAHLKRKGFRSLCFNAWEADFASDPLVAFIGEIDREIDRLISGAESPKELKQSWKKVKDIGAYLVRRAVPVGVKLATAGALDLDKFTEESIAKWAESVAREQIEKYDSTKSKISEFKDRLAKFIKSLDKGQKVPVFPLVFFVDELDRCRPTYAIELLERIKHFFGIEEIVFVLAMDKAQLSSSIQAVYGRGIDVDGYLRRFIDLEYRLPSRDPEKFVASLVAQFGFVDLLSRAGMRDARRAVEIGARVFSGLAGAFELSLRVQEQCFATLAVILLTADARSMHFPLVIGLLAFKAADEKLYNDFVAHKKSVDELLAYIKATQRGQAFMEESEGVMLETFLLKSRLGDDSTTKILDGYKAIRDSAKPGVQPQAIALRAIDVLSHVLSNGLNYDMVADAAKSIAFAGEFRVT